MIFPFSLFQSLLRVIVRADANVFLVSFLAVLVIFVIIIIADAEFKTFTNSLGSVDIQRWKVFTPSALDPFQYRAPITTSSFRLWSCEIQ